MANEDDIDIQALIRVILRNKLIVFLFLLLGVFYGSAKYLFGTKVWQGEFQIVLSDPSKKTNNNSLLGEGNLAGLVGLNSLGTNDSMLTEVEILKSPSVLMNVFDFVKAEKNLNDDELRFNDWKNSLDIELIKTTSVLYLSYQDTDKKLILPVLKKISETYQEYSGKSRLRSIELGIDYFTDQVNVYRDQSVKSLEEAQKFGYEQDLSVTLEEKNFGEMGNVINVEKIRVQAANEIRQIDIKLDQIENFKDNEFSAVIFSDELPSLDSQLKTELDELEKEIIVYRSIFTENEPELKLYLERRRNLVALINEKTKNFLLAKKYDAAALLKASERPKGVLIKYKRLLNKAAKDAKTLNYLEDQLRIFNLEKAKYEDPWELITRPTLFEKPIAPEKKKIIIYAIAGLFLGLIVSFILEKRKNIICESSEILSLAKTFSIEKFFEIDANKVEESLFILSKATLNKSEQLVTFFILDGVNSENEKQIIKFIKENYSNSKIKFTKTIREIDSNSKLILVSSLGTIRFNEFTDINNKLLLLNMKPYGLVVFNQYSKNNFSI